jgi:hypothetical protein
VKELYDELIESEVLDELEEKYSLDRTTVSRPTIYIMEGSISFKDLPIFIEKGAKVDRNIALKCAIKVCRHFLKRYSQYHHIGNVDAYIEDWKDELREG